MIDLHCHILPGLDDGARSLAEARDLARSAAAEGVVAIAATPHVRADWPTSPERMEHGVAELRRDFAEAGIPVDVLHGGEIELGRLWELGEEALERFSLGQTGRYVLVEFPYRGWPLALEPAVSALASAGMAPLLAHPERNPEVQDRPARLEPAVRAGALVQVTAASLAGQLGENARSAAKKLLDRGLVHVLATDAHGPHIRQGGMAAAVEALADAGLARYLTAEPPAAIVAGDALPPAPQPRRRFFTF